MPEKKESLTNRSRGTRQKSAAPTNRAKADIADATRFLNQRAGQADRRLAVIGFSLGAYYALDPSVADPEHIRSVVLLPIK
jgi:dienelactone hydrolase